MIWYLNAPSFNPAWVLAFTAFKLRAFSASSKYRFGQNLISAPYMTVWWFSCQKYRIYTVHTYKCMVLANPKQVQWQGSNSKEINITTGTKTWGKVVEKIHMRATPEGDDRGPKWACFLNFPRVWAPWLPVLKLRGKKAQGGKSCNSKAAATSKQLSLKFARHGPYFQSWPEPFTYTYIQYMTHMFGDIPAKDSAYTPYVFNSDQPCTCLIGRSLNLTFRARAWCIWLARTPIQWFMMC